MRMVQTGGADGVTPGNRAREVVALVNGRGRLGIYGAPWALPTAVYQWTSPDEQDESFDWAGLMTYWLYEVPFRILRDIGLRSVRNTSKALARFLRGLFQFALNMLIYGSTLLAAAESFGQHELTPKKESTSMTMKVTSSAFQAGQAIPATYTCDGVDISPPLHWSGVPAAAKSLALICDDPDAPVGTWVHWVFYDLPVPATDLTEKVPTLETLPSGAKQGINDFRRVGYAGPCPPPGKPHRYYFKLYALDADLALKPRANKAELLRAMEGHLLAEGQLMGIYQRRR